ncbi:hypothetical protein BRC78_03290 [Halobacteriales archaeon QH_8_68_33]|jgi:hypothetical protein|nr:MAG: hypothetical protein BRC78_03290 [Halobacteriales archaeon QH_8_68_33]
MRAVTKPLDEQARSIFDDLGYTVSSRGSELLAERKWRVVHVTTAEGDGDPPESGEYRCFVASHEDVDAVERRLEQADPDYEWAVIGVDEDGDYEVTARPPAR